MNDVTVYWACLNNEWLRAKEPINMYKSFSRNDSSIKTSLNMCPGFKDYMNNYFGLQSIYDYQFIIKDGKLFSQDYNEKFFNEAVSIRSLENKVFSFHQSFIFFTEEKSLEMSCGIQPFLEDGNINERCIVVPGMLDIGKWFRAIDFAFILKNNFNEFKIKEGEIFQYIKFNTNKKIKFKQFGMSAKLDFYTESIASAKDNRRPKIRQMSEYYKIFNSKKSILEEIKNNLVE